MLKALSVRCMDARSLDGSFRSRLAKAIRYGVPGFGSDLGIGYKFNRFDIPGLPDFNGHSCLIAYFQNG